LEKLSTIANHYMVIVGEFSVVIAKDDPDDTKTFYQHESKDEKELLRQYMRELTAIFMTVGDGALYQ